MEAAAAELGDRAGSRRRGGFWCLVEEQARRERKNADSFDVFILEPVVRGEEGGGRREAKEKPSILLS